MTLDAISDLTLAEGVFQVTQGNYERAGATLKAMSEGHAPPETEIINTPRGGAVVNHRIAIHSRDRRCRQSLGWRRDTAIARGAGVEPVARRSHRAAATPCSSTSTYDLDGDTRAHCAVRARLQPIDLIYLVNDEAGDDGRHAPGQRSDGARSAHRSGVSASRARAADPGFDAVGQHDHSVHESRWISRTTSVRWFEMLPLLRTLAPLVTTCRPLGADDYQLPSEQNTDPALAGNLQGLGPAADEAVARWRPAPRCRPGSTQLQTVLDDVPDGRAERRPGRSTRPERRRL